VEQFKYLRTTFTNQNYIQEEINSRLKSGNVYGCENWSLTLREESSLRLLKNSRLRSIFWPKREEVTGKWRTLHNDELNDLYSSPNIVHVIKSRRVGWTGHVARMGERTGIYRVWMGKPEEEDHLEDSGVDGSTILRCIFKKWDVGAWTGSS
jgi:hypothetical protein